MTKYTFYKQMHEIVKKMAFYKKDPLIKKFYEQSAEDFNNKAMKLKKHEVNDQITINQSKILEHYAAKLHNLERGIDD